VAVDTGEDEGAGTVGEAVGEMDWVGDIPFGEGVGPSDLHAPSSRAGAKSATNARLGFWAWRLIGHAPQAKGRSLGRAAPRANGRLAAGRRSPASPSPPRPRASLRMELPSAQSSVSTSGFSPGMRNGRPGSFAANGLPRHHPSRRPRHVSLAIASPMAKPSAAAPSRGKRGEPTTTRAPGEKLTRASFSSSIDIANQPAATAAMARNERPSPEWQTAAVLME